MEAGLGGLSEARLAQLAIPASARMGVRCKLKVQDRFT